jgi:hypothetical protein
MTCPQQKIPPVLPLGHLLITSHLLRIVDAMTVGRVL